MSRPRSAGGRARRGVSSHAGRSSSGIVDRDDRDDDKLRPLFGVRAEPGPRAEVAPERAELGCCQGEFGRRAEDTRAEFGARANGSFGRAAAVGSTAGAAIRAEGDGIRRDVAGQIAAVEGRVAEQGRHLGVLEEALRTEQEQSLQALEALLQQGALNDASIAPESAAAAAAVGMVGGGGPGL